MKNGNIYLFHQPNWNRIIAIFQDFGIGVQEMPEGSNRIFKDISTHSPPNHVIGIGASRNREKCLFFKYRKS